jgi:hypothetical protein
MQLKLRDMCKILVVKFQRRMTLEISGRRWEDLPNIKTDPRKIICEDLDCIQLAQNTLQM